MFKIYKYALVIILFSAILLAVAVSSCHPGSMSQNQQPIEIIAVLSPNPPIGQPINPAGPIVEITLKNVSDEPVISLTATLELYKSFEFIFDVTPSNPLLPGDSISSRQLLIQGAISSDVSDPLTINATLQNGDEFVYTRQIQISEPSGTNSLE